jgi:hypothetical protein
MKASQLKKLLGLLLLLSLCTAYGGSSSRCVVETSGHFFPRKGNRPASILDLRLEKVTISGLTMEEALFRLADGINTSTHGKISFPVSTENSRDLMGRIRKRDPRVTFDGSNVSLRQVVNALCHQSGWSYAKTTVGYQFIDDDSFFKKGG